MSSDFNSASDMNDIYRNMEKLHKKLKDLGYDLDEISDQLKLYHATEAKRIHQIRGAMIDYERITHYQKERLKANKEDKDHRTKRNMEEHAEYFRQIRRNMRMRQSHSSLNEQLDLTTKALFGGGLGLGAVFGQLIKGGKAVADAEEERVDLEKDIDRAYAMRDQAGQEGNVADYHKYQERAIAAQKELKEHLSSPSSRLGRLSVFGKSISERLAGGAEFFKKHKLGILLSIGSIGLLVTALKLVYNTSPMMQASVKLLGLMWNLGLRPIGDFFGFVMRPIFVLLLRSFILPWFKVAYPFYQRWGSKIGEFMVNPSWSNFMKLFTGVSDAELKLVAFNLAIGTITTLFVVGGGFWLAIKGIQSLINRILGITPKTTTTTTTTKTPTTTTTTKPVLPVGYTQNKAAIPYTIGGVGTEKGTTVGTPAATNKNLGYNIKTVQAKALQAWQQIQAAATKMGKDMQWQIKRFETVLKNNRYLKSFTKAMQQSGKTQGGKVTGAGGIFGSFVPAITELLFPEGMAEFDKIYKDLMPWLKGDGGVGLATGMAEGGIIREPIYGVGKSGREYTFGEQGAEIVTPMGKGVGGSSITINIQNMSGSTQDLNNLRQTILAVMQEANTRSGRI